MTLRSSAEPLDRAYGLAMFDLDGVVYLLSNPVPGVPEAIGRAEAAGCQSIFVTNNASRLTSTVADSLRSMGIDCRDDQVVSSAQAAARAIADHCGEGAATFMTGSPAFRAALENEGLAIVDDPREAVAVAQGFFPTMQLKDLASATLAARRGAYWVVANLDATLPTPDGPMPGMGAYVKVVETALGRGPDVVAGKPRPTIFRAALERVPDARPLMVGDRPDSDIEGANALGIDSLLVFSGVVKPASALRLPPERRPTYLGWTAAELNNPQPEVTVEEPGAAHCEEWSVKLVSGTLTLSGKGDELSAWRALCAAAWSAVDAGAEFSDGLAAVGAEAESALTTA
ncbi:HAD-IIA family hydrolase [Salininema proteolyticum]|uniref:HAD-IIA family hydrolase n=1 Tax=Salininema proteolyticum TaxID=1607685 RepID=A0ABV8U2I2_9ACTN